MVVMFYKVFYFLPRPGHVSPPLRVGYRGEGGARFGGWPPGKIDTPGQDFHQRATFSSKREAGPVGLLTIRCGGAGPAGPPLGVPVPVIGAPCPGPRR